MAVRRSKPSTRPAPVAQKPAKTARFVDLVKICGAPEVVDLWTAPEDNPQLQSAVRQNRVLTILRKQSGKDYGLVGFVRERNVSYVIFEKAVTKFAGKHIVGIKYDLIRPSPPQGRIVQPETGKNDSSKSRTGPVSHRETRLEREPSVARKTPSTPQRRKFQAVIRLTATQEVRVEVEAADSAEAKAKALAQTATSSFSPETIARRVKRLGLIKPK